MRPARHRGIEVSGWALVAVAAAGTWVGHSAEYLRVYGLAGFESAASRSVHLYMGPVGLALFGMAVAGVYGSLLARRRLEHLLLMPAERRTLAFPWVLWTVWLTQLAAYVVQENAEAKAMGVHLHGLQAVTGIHRWAPLVQLCVAALGAGTLWLLRRPVTRLARAIRAAVAALFQRRRTVNPPTMRPLDIWSPEARWGALRWCRPPPLAATPA